MYVNMEKIYRVALLWWKKPPADQSACYGCMNAKERKAECLENIVWLTIAVSAERKKTRRLLSLLTAFICGVPIFYKNLFSYKCVIKITTTIIMVIIIII